MIIDTISDLHGYYPQLEGGDLLIVAGDLTARDTGNDWLEVCIWLIEQRYKKIIVIAGNHDNCLKWNKEHVVMDENNNSRVQYLCDSGTEFEGLKIWGSPWTKTFPNMNPHCKAFTCDSEEELAEKWALIPDDVDILITHSPPYGVFDEVKKYTCNGKSTEHVGSVTLVECLDKINPRLCVFGHIHEEGGKMAFYKGKGKGIICVNASHVNEVYEPVNKPIRIIL